VVAKQNSSHSILPEVRRAVEVRLPLQCGRWWTRRGSVAAQPNEQMNSALRRAAAGQCDGLAARRERLFRMTRRASQGSPDCLRQSSWERSLSGGTATVRPHRLLRIRNHTGFTLGPGPGPASSSSARLGSTPTTQYCCIGRLYIVQCIHPRGTATSRAAAY
jgi:hypothetical protein